MATDSVTLDVAGVDVRITNPEKLFFPALGMTKLDLARYYLAVGDGALVGARDRPTTMYRWPNGVDAPDDAFFQKRVPDKGRPEWLQSVVVRFPSGRQADMLVVADLAHLVWAINLGCIDLNPWPVRASDVDHPDELRVDLDPTPEFRFEHAREVAQVVREVLEEHELVGWPKTSGKRGIHIYVRIEPRWSFTEVRRAALALAREVERREPALATTAWWKEERHGVFVDYNQNARDRTIASVYSVRPVAAGTVSCPLDWDEVASARIEDFTIASVPERVASKGDPGAGIDDAVGSLDALLDLAGRDESGGLGDAPWPPHFPKAQNEPIRAQPSRRRQGRRNSGS
ncbi:MAG: DNA polymerase domain-containing protein [Actinomycetota bacterium]|nr:DNA polymerase domain-containing protein [Actinomycetota bacterium]